MLLATESQLSSSLLSTRDIPEFSVPHSISFGKHKQYKMSSRNSPVVSFWQAKILIALTRNLSPKMAVIEQQRHAGAALAATVHCIEKSGQDIVPESDGYPLMSLAKMINPKKGASS